MLTVHEPYRGATRRSFLRVGALALGGLTLGDLLRLRADAPGTARPKSVVMVHLSGGPSHLDMYDMKPAAPAEYRGEFRPIKTNVSGIEICELMPGQAKLADKFAILRGAQLAHLHTANEFYSGYPWQDSPRASVPGEAQRPAFGSVVSQCRGDAAGVPPYVSLGNKPDWEQAYYAGLEHEPFRVGGGSAREPLENLGRRLSQERLDSRKNLLHAFDTLRRDLDVKVTAPGLDAFQGRALQIVATGKVRDAFDLDKEPDRVRERYGRGPVKHGSHPGPVFLQARRLIEAGVSVVTICPFGAGPWDTHSHNFKTLRELIPPLDQALSAFITDLHDRSLLQDVAVVMGGEFGRTPRIGDQTPDGRSHWPDAGFLWVSGGGLKTGQVVGATDARGEQPVGRPIRMQHVLATLYRVLGIDPTATIADYNGRPQYVLEDPQPVAELL
jgi:hypothetical protein